MNRTCEHCGTAFEVQPSRVKHGRGKHCSPACQYAAIKARPRVAVTFRCIGCGVTFERYPSWVKRKGAGKYCTRTCRDKNWFGPNNPLWQDGSGVYKRGPHWHSIRRRILARDKVCQCCGASDRLHVHHKIPFRMWHTAEAANADANLITLCATCHRREEARFRWVTPKFEAA